MTSWATSHAAAESRCTAGACTNADSLLAQPDRLVEVEWAPQAGSVFVVSIQVEALDPASAAI